MTIVTVATPVVSIVGGTGSKNASMSQAIVLVGMIQSRCAAERFLIYRANRECNNKEKDSLDEKYAHLVVRPGSREVTPRFNFPPHPPPPPPPLRTVCNDSILFALTHMPLRSSCPGNFVLTLQWSASCSSPDLNQASPASFLRRRSVDAQRQNS